MNDKLKFVLLALVVPLLLIILAVMGIEPIIMIFIAFIWIGLSVVVFSPLEEP